MTHIVHVVGARPQFVKVAAVLAQTPPGHVPVLIHTGQHYDASLSRVFFDELGMRAPDHNLGIGSGSHGAQTGRMLAAIEAVLVTLPRGVMVVYGDTNSTIAAALAATKLHWPVAHVEAGLRSFDRRMPEEINRIATDAISDRLLCPTQGAVDQLTREGMGDRAEFTGDVMLDVALDFASRARTQSAIGRFLAGADQERPAAFATLSADAARPKGYFLATVHRAANTDDAARLAAIFGALGRLERPVVLPLHPRTRAALTRHGVALPSTVRCIEPAGYLDFAALLAGAAAVLTDSGGVQKEALFARTPCVTLRDTTEWTETLSGGWNVLVDADPEAIVAAASLPMPTAPAPVDAYGDGQAAARIHTAIDALRP
ncbi:MAG: UDP-GlcNAc3NAcA epimerase [Bradymonadia bacterium]